MLASFHRRSSSEGRPPVTKNPARKDQAGNEDLALFRDLFRREKEKNVSLLLPVSVEFDPGDQGSNQLYKISSKKGSGKDILATEGGKNDYNWLKTPPSTPLFPSLEFEAGDPNLLVQMGLPTTKPLKPTRFASEAEEAKPRQPAKQPWSSGSMSVKMSPGTRPNPSTRSPSSPISNHRSRRSSTLAKGAAVKEDPMNPTSSTVVPAKKQNPDAKPRSRGVSPSRNLIKKALKTIGSQAKESSVTSGRPRNPEAKPEPEGPRRRSCSPSPTLIKTAATIVQGKELPVIRGRPNNPVASLAEAKSEPETPTRSLIETAATVTHGEEMSETRGRPFHPVASLVEAKPEPETPTRSLIETAVTVTHGEETSATRGRPFHPVVSPAEAKLKPEMPRWRSCSPSMARGRKGINAITGQDDGEMNSDMKARIVGSRMVDRVLSARRNFGGELNGQTPAAGFGRLMPQASLDFAKKQMEIKKNSSYTTYTYYHNMANWKKRG